MKISKEAKIGLVALVSLVVLILGINLLRGAKIFSRDIVLYSIYDNANGLTSSDPVYMHGYKIGQVDRVELDYANRRARIIIRYSVKKDALIPKNSLARIYSADILGTKALEIIPGDQPIYVEARDTLPGDIELSITEMASRVISPLQQRTVSLITSLDSLISVFYQVLEGDTRENIEGSFTSIALTLQNVERATGRLDKILETEGSQISIIMENINQITTTLARSSDTINYIMSNFAAISDSIAAADFKQTVDRANAAMSDVESIIANVKEGKGSLGRLVENEELARRLESSAGSLDRLITDIRRNPQRYLNFSVISLGGSGKDKE